MPSRLNAANAPTRSSSRAPVPPRISPVEQVHRRHVERQAQGVGRGHRPVEGGVEIAGPVAAERLRRVHQQALGMDQAVLQRQRI
jgi:hypothetical protein